MGIRPSMVLVCGITDLRVRDYEITDLRYTGPRAWEWGDSVPLPTKPDNLDSLSLEERKRLSDILHRLGDWDMDSRCWVGKNYENVLTYGNGEYSVAGVVGYIVDKLPYANDCLYALALLYPKFAKCGFEYLPQVPLEEDCSQGAGWLKFLREQGEDWLRERFSENEFSSIQNQAKVKEERLTYGWNYCWFGDYINMYANATLYLFETIGLKVAREKLKLFLYWKWS